MTVLEPTCPFGNAYCVTHTARVCAPPAPTSLGSETCDCIHPANDPHAWRTPAPTEPPAEGVAHECVLAVVGSIYEGAAPETVERVKAAIREAFDRHDPRAFVSGGAAGVDSWAAEEAYRRGMTDADVTEHLPKHRRWQPEGFKDRNERVAQDCEHLVRIYDPASKTYGSGWTADAAARLGKEVERIPVARPVPATERQST